MIILCFSKEENLGVREGKKISTNLKGIVDTWLPVAQIVSKKGFLVNLWPLRTISTLLVCQINSEIFLCVIGFLRPSLTHSALLRLSRAGRGD